jgi:hypothetical protein
MEVSFIHFAQQVSATTTRDLGTWDTPVVPRVGEQVSISSPGDLSSDAVSWDVISVIHDVANQHVVCSVTRTDVVAHRLLLAWSADLAAPPSECINRSETDCS